MTSSSQKKKNTIAENIEKLEALLEWFESEEITVESSIQKYEEALKLSQELQSQLDEAKNQVEVIKKKFSAQ